MALALFLPPKPAAHVAAWAVGHPEIAPALISICHRESRCTAIGVHSIDSHISPRAYWGQINLGHLDRTCQKHGSTPGRWSTRGAWGLNAAAHWQFLPRCYQPELLDVPLVSALIAARKYLRSCVPTHERRWCGPPPSRATQRAVKAGPLPWGPVVVSAIARPAQGA